MKTWVANGWKTSDGKSVKNRDLIEAIHAHVQRHGRKMVRELGRAPRLRLA